MKVVCACANCVVEMFYERTHDPFNLMPHKHQIEYSSGVSGNTQVILTKNK